MLIIYLSLCSSPHLALLFLCLSLELSKQTLQHIAKTLLTCLLQEQVPVPTHRTFTPDLLIVTNKTSPSPWQIDLRQKKTLKSGRLLLPSSHGKPT
jgi:hypothetical protein